ncbi:MAG: MYXO-CTERM sorting domain-containing protein [Sandaracinaceae bacterium]
MPACEEGQHLETNPVGPDDTHHAGGQCVGEPSGCAVGVGGQGAPPGLVVLVGAGMLVVRRRAR